MAVSFTRVGNPTVFGNKKVLLGDFTFSGNYPDEGETVAASTVGFANAIEAIFFDGVAIAADGETAVGLKYDYTSGKIITYESAAAGTALGEKTAAEAYPAGLNARALVIGF